MAKLHHNSKRYEVQEYRPHTISWKPIAHATDYEEAEATMRRLADRKRDPIYRVLDRQHGAGSAKVVAGIGEARELNSK